MRGWPEPPRWLVWVSCAVIAVGAVVCVLGALRIGVTVDETFHVVRLRNYLDHGWYLLDDDLGPSGPGAWVEDSYVYAPVATIFLHLLNVVAGHESWTQVSTSADAYAVRHLGVAFVGAGAVAAVAAMTRLVSGTWRWAAISSAVLVSLPMWTGHAMFNVKDVPVATGYTFVTLGCMLILTIERGSRRARTGAALLVLLGTVLAVGTRPAIWPGLAAAGALVLVVVLRRRRLEPGGWWRVGDAVIGFAGGLALLMAIYPVVFTHPVRWALGATSESAGYQGDRFWGYIPLTVLSTVPVVLLLFGVLGSLTRLSSRWSRRGEGWGPADTLMALVVLQALLLPVLLMIRVPSLNGGLRHLLFAAPAVAILIAAGVAQVMRDVSGPWSRVVVPGLAAVGLAVPLAAQVQLFPLGYAYANPVTDAAGITMSADFWQASFRDYADDIPAGAFVVCGAKLDDEGRPLRQMPNGGQSWLVVGEDCATTGPLSVLQPFLPATPGADEVASPEAVAPEFVALVVYDDPSPQGCTEIAHVDRRRLLASVVASRAMLCPLNVPAYSGPLTFTGAGAGAGHLLGGWTGNGGDTAVTVAGSASLGFRMDGARDGLEIEVTGSSDADVDFFVNNVPAAHRQSPEGWIVTPAAELPELGEPGNVVLTLRSTGAATRVAGLEVRVAQQ